jgi:hypothetical protein
MDGQLAVYLYTAALEVNVLIHDPDQVHSQSAANGPYGAGEYSYRWSAAGAAVTAAARLILYGVISDIRHRRPRWRRR